MTRFANAALPEAAEAALVALPERRPKRGAAGEDESPPLRIPAFPSWARTLPGADEGRRSASQNAEGRIAKGSAAQCAVEWLSEGRTLRGADEGRADPGLRTEESAAGGGEAGDGVAIEVAKVGAAAEAAFLAGAALAALDPLVRHEAASFRGCFSARFALTAAAASAKILGRAEDEAALRDAFYLRPPGGDPGPAGRLLAAFRIVAGRRPDLIFAAEAAEKVLAELGIPGPSVIEGSGESEKASLIETLDAAAALAERDRAPVFAAAEAAALACRGLAPNAGRAGAIFTLVLADAVLASSLAWPRFVPLLCASKEAAQMCLRAGRTQSAGSQTESLEAAFFEPFCLAIAGAAARAHDLYCGLARRAEKLEAALPKLRAKGAAGALERILSEDAVTAAMRPGGLSDRAARRLFGRLAALGVLRELSGRPAFRLYGL